MRKEQMVGSRLPVELVQDLEMIERVEQTDRSTALRKLLHKAVGDWKREHYARQYGDGHDAVSSCRGCECLIVGNDGIRAAPKNRGPI